MMPYNISERFRQFYFFITRWILIAEKSTETRVVPKSLTVVIQPLSTRLIKPNFYFVPSLSLRQSKKMIPFYYFLCCQVNNIVNFFFHGRWVFFTLSKNHLTRFHITDHFRILHFSKRRFKRKCLPFSRKEAVSFKSYLFCTLRFKNTVAADLEMSTLWL